MSAELPPLTLPAPAGGTVAPVPAAVPGPDRDERYHGLDALRAFALLLGVVFHAAESFEPGVDYWAIQDPSTSRFLEFFRYASHSFRLEFFFLIAGFFAHLLFHRRGWRGFVRNRLSRILVPLVVGWLLLYPLLVSLWLLGASVSGRLAAFGVPPEAQHLPVWQLTLGFFMTLGFVKRFDLTHLWFLHQLLVIYAAALVLRGVWRGLLDPHGRWTRAVDAGLARLCGSRWKTLWLVVPVWPMLMTMNSYGVDTPKESLWPHLPTTLLFGFLFTMGWLLHRQPALLGLLARGWRTNLLAGVLLALTPRLVSRGLEAVGLAQGHPAVFRVVHGLFYGLMMGAFVLGFFGLFWQTCNGPGRVWRYMADSSYWIYIVHLPLVVALQIWVAPVGLPWFIKWPFILAVAFPILFISYHYLVRSTFIGAQLNGRRHPRGGSAGRAPGTATAGSNRAPSTSGADR